MTKVLITDHAHDVLVSRLRDAGIAVNVQTDLGYEALIKAAQGCDGLVVRSKVGVDSHFIDAVPSLRCIGRLGAGMETIDVEYAERHGITCVNSPEGNRDAVGEHAVGLLLALLNHIASADAEVRRGEWHREANRGLELGGMTVGIIGYGNMGQAFAQRLGGFGCRVLFYDKYVDFEDSRQVELDVLQREADVVSFHVPLTAETRHYLDFGFIAAMNKPFFLLNTSRGAVVDTQALVEGMEKGMVRGAALDVIEYENMSNDGLNAMPEPMRYLTQSSRTVLSPHVAGWTVESKYKLAAVLADKIIEVLK